MWTALPLITELREATLFYARQQSSPPGTRQQSTLAHRDTRAEISCDDTMGDEEGESSSIVECKSDRLDNWPRLARQGTR